MAEQYTTETLVDLVRADLGDTVEPYLVSDALILEALDSAQREYAEETLCLFDATSFTQDLTAGEPLYLLDDRILKIRGAYLSTAQRQLEVSTLREVTTRNIRPDYGVLRTDWRNATGIPEVLVTDFQNGYVRLVPTPTAVDTLTYEAYLYPTSISDDIDAPLSIPDNRRRSLVWGALNWLYGIHDAEIYDADKANKAARLWQSALLKGAANEQRTRRGAGNVKMNSRGVW